MQKKVLIITAVFPPEPVVSATISRDIANELATTENVEVFCPRPTRPMGYKFNLNYKNFIAKYKVVYSNSYTCPESKIYGRVKENFSFGINCLKYIKGNYNDLKIIYINVWPLISQAIIIKISKKYKIPCILHVQDIYPESYTNKLPSLIKKIINYLVIPVDKYVLNNCSSIIAISENMKIKLSTTRNINSDKISVVSNWQNENDFCSRAKDLKEEVDKLFTFMYLGNIGPLAGVDFLIECYFKAKIPNSRLVIAGSGSQKNYCQNFALTINVSHVEFWDVPEGTVSTIQAESDVMLLPVRKGGAITSIPSKLPAYMFSAKPIIGSVDLESDTSKTIYNSNCGLVVAPENENLLIDAMWKMSKMSKDNLHSLGMNGYNYALKNFSKKANIKKIISLFNSSIKI